MPLSEPPVHDLEARIARLTPGQRDCLRLVHDHATSKEIARELGISRHTVDQRLRLAIQVLGVGSRREAAIIFKAADQAGHAHAYQPSAYQASHIADDPVPSPSRPTAERGDEALSDEPERRARDEGEEPDFHDDAPERREAVLSDAAAWSPAGFAPQGFATAPARPQPVLRLWGGVNDLTMSQRVIVIAILMIAGMLAFGMLIAGMEALTQLRTR